MIITGNFKIETEAEEEEIFAAMKEFFKDNFQNYNFSVSGKEITLKDTYKRPEEKIIELEKYKTKTTHADAVTKIDNKAVLG